MSTEDIAEIAEVSGRRAPSHSSMSDQTYNNQCEIAEVSGRRSPSHSLMSDQTYNNQCEIAEVSGRRSPSHSSMSNQTYNNQCEIAEVSGRRSPSHSSMSDQTYNNQCDECAKSGKTACATGFCKNCTDYLCKPCTDQHKRVRSLRDHKILLGKDMPKLKPDTTDMEKCAIHSDRPVEAYCADDDTFGCVACLLVGHRSCKNVGLLSDMSRGVESSKEFLDIQKAASIFQTIQDEYKQAIAMHLSINNECYTKTLEEFQHFRSDVLSTLEEIGKKVQGEADKLKEENERKLNTLAEKIEHCSKEVKQYMVKLDEMNDRKQHELVFVALIKNGWRVMNAVERLKALPQDIVIETYHFHSDTAIRQEISRTNNLHVETAPFTKVRYSELVEEDRNRTVLTSAATICSSVSTINIATREDMNDYWVRGLLKLSETKLFLTDWNNSCLKLLDTTSNTIIRRRILKEQPFDITDVPSCRLAVTFPEVQQIQFFTADRNLDFCGSICASGKCYGLHCTGDRLIVTYLSPAQVKIIDMKGNVIQVLKHDTSGKELFQEPVYLATSHDNKVIYVSDNGNNTITSLDQNGIVYWVYKDKEMSGPRGVTLGECGCLYICSRNGDTIHVVSHDGVRLAIIPNIQSGVKCPLAVYFSRIDRSLYVSSRSYDPKHDNFIRRISLQ